MFVGREVIFSIHGVMKNLKWHPDNYDTNNHFEILIKKVFCERPIPDPTISIRTDFYPEIAQPQAYPKSSRCAADSVRRPPSSNLLLCQFCLLGDALPYKDQSSTPSSSFISHDDLLNDEIARAILLAFSFNFLKSAQSCSEIVSPFSITVCAKSRVQRRATNKISIRVRLDLQELLETGQRGCSQTCPPLLLVHFPTRSQLCFSSDRFRLHFPIPPFGPCVWISNFDALPSWGRKGICHSGNF